jgi:DNA-binding response OmpR family regulator
MNEGLNQKRILVVDDELLFARLLSLAFEDEGYRVVVAANKDDAVRLGREFDPHLLFSDWMLKDGSSGLEVATALLTQNPKLQVILISGLAAEAEEAAGGTIKIFRFLTKPCSLDTAIQTVREALGAEGE